MQVAIDYHIIFPQDDKQNALFILVSTYRKTTDWLLIIEMIFTIIVLFSKHANTYPSRTIL